MEGSQAHDWHRADKPWEGSMGCKEEDHLIVRQPLKPEGFGTGESLLMRGNTDIKKLLSSRHRPLRRRDDSNTTWTVRRRTQSDTFLRLYEEEF